jgi:hypothetical protein
MEYRRRKSSVMGPVLAANRRMSMTANPQDVRLGLRDNSFIGSQLSDSQQSLDKEKEVGLSGENQCILHSHSLISFQHYTFFTDYLHEL